MHKRLTSLFIILSLSTTLFALTLKSLHLESNATHLNLGDTVTLSVVGTYSDNSTKDMIEKVEWFIDNKKAVQIHNHTLTAKQDKPVRLLAKVGKKVSNVVTLDIYWEVDGYRLPPKPDKVLNDATLGGVDANSNGVRDDVERNIYEKCPVKLQREFIMDRAKFYQLTLKTSVSEARKIVKKSISIGNCLLHLKHIGQRSVTWREDRTFIKNLTFNTKERIRKYLDYNLALSGGVYGSSPSDWNRDACSEEIKQVLVEMGL